MSTDHDCFLVILDPANHGRTSVRVMFDDLGGGRVTVAGVFRIRNDTEIDFGTLPPDTKEEILEKCKEELKRRNQDNEGR